MRMLAALLLAAVLVAGCGGEERSVPEVGEVVLVAGAGGWPQAQQDELGLEEVDLDLLTDDCGNDAGRSASRDLVDEALEGALDGELQRVLGAGWGDAWVDTCDDDRGKVGVAPAAGAVGVRRARRVLRWRGIADEVDLVGVRSSLRELGAAQRRFPVVERDGVVSAGVDPSVNAVVLGVARSVDARGWDALRARAKAAGVNVVLERLGTDADPTVVD